MILLAPVARPGSPSVVSTRRTRAAPHALTPPEPTSVICSTVRPAAAMPSQAIDGPDLALGLAAIPAPRGSRHAPAARSSPMTMARKPIYTQEYRDMLLRLREARRAAGLTQAKVALHFERLQSFVSNCESGQRRIDPTELARFAKLYDRALDFFLPDNPIVKAD